jgi:hypothetical protein
MTDLHADTRPTRMRDTARGMPPPKSTPPHPTPPVDELHPDPALDGRPPRKGGRKRPIAMVRSVPAGHAILVAAGALLFAMIFNSHAMVHAGEGMKAGTTRTLVLGVAKPLDKAAHTLYLDRPRKWLDSLFGHSQAPTGPSALSKLPSTADDRPLGTGSKNGSDTPKGPQSPPPDGAKTSTAPAGPDKKPVAPAVPALRVPTKAAPLKLLVAGDSMTEFLGPSLINQGSAQGKLKGDTVTKYGTGLVRPDFFDWSIYAQQLMDQQNPEAVVVMMGGNDGQGITLANGQVLPDGTDAWAKEYRRRVEVVMRIFSGDGKRRVYWVPMPIPRSEKLAADYHLMDLAVADAAAVVPGVTDVNIVNRLSNNGQYSDYLPGLNGQTILARARDGIHLSQDGANLAATLVLQALNKDWHLTG